MGKNPHETEKKASVVRGGASSAKWGKPLCGFCNSPTRVSGSKGVKYKACQQGHTMVIKGGHHNRRRKNKAAKRKGRV